MNGKEHVLVGLAVGAAVSAMCQCLDRSETVRRFDWGELCLAAAAGGAAALLPDVIEPANHPHHRQFFHSLAAAALVAFLISGRHTEGWHPLTRRLVFAIGMGYLSHIGLDCTTPMAVNLI